MNLLYCGDSNILDGLIISVLSMLKNTKERLHIYVLTMQYQGKKKTYKPLTKEMLESLDKKLRKKNKDNFIKLIDITDKVNKCLPKANINTFFTPYCMLRLYADEVEGIPDKILYLDNDVVCLKDPWKFYNIPNDNYELVGVLDYYGCHVYKRNVLEEDYINSGVLLLNMKLIKETGLFSKCRVMCRDKKMLLPDQSALNHYVKKKLIVDRKYNEQKESNDETVFRHFTTTFKFWPRFKRQTIKPWQIGLLHDILNDYTFEDILEEYNLMKEEE